MFVSGIIRDVHLATEMQFFSSHVSFFAFFRNRVLLSMDTGHKNTTFFFFGISLKSVLLNVVICGRSTQDLPFLDTASVIDDCGHL